MSDQFVWPSDAARAENDELNRVCEYAEQLHDNLQAARAEQAGSGEADFRAEIRTERDPSDEYVSFLTFISDGKASPYLYIPETLGQTILDEALRRLNTHPQPAQQGSVPEELSRCLEVQLQDGNWNYDPYMHGMANGLLLAEAICAGKDPQYKSAPDKWLFNSTPQSGGAGWVKCSDRFPKLGQRVQLFSQGVIQHMMPLFDESDEGPFWDFEVHDYNPPVDVSRDQWRPLPNPPAEQEGE